MEAFERYCLAYLAAVPHPFGGGDTVTFNARELRQAVACARLVLQTPAQEPRLADLHDRFLSAFHAYLDTPRDQGGPLVNAVERLAQLVEPYLKKLVLLFYSSLTYNAGTRTGPLWHYGTEQILKTLGLVNTDLKATPPAYWESQPAESAIWRLAFVSRHKGTHEAHLLDLPSLERTATAVIASLVLAARYALSDPRSTAGEHEGLSDALRFQELLRIRAQTHQVTGELPTTIEHVRLYRVRDQVSLDDDQARLLFRSYCAGRGPAFFFLRGRPERELVRWAYDFSGASDEPTARGAVAFLLAAGQYVSLRRVAALFSDSHSRFRLAAYIQRAPSRRDLDTLWQLALRHRSPLVREAAMRSFTETASETDKAWLMRAAGSTSPRAFSLFARSATRLARKERLQLYRRHLAGERKHLRQLAAIGVGVVGSHEDIERLDGLAHSSRRDIRTKAVAAMGLGMLAARHGEGQLLRKLLRRESVDVARLAVKGIGLLRDGAFACAALTAFKRARFETAEALRESASLTVRPTFRHLLDRAKLDDVGRLLVLGLCRCSGPGDFVFLVRLMARYRDEPRWDSYEIMSEVARLVRGGRGGRKLLKDWMGSSEFWKYYGAHRPKDRLPVTRYENLVLMRGLIGLAFGEIAGPRDMSRLRRMLRHSYWAVRRGGANGLVRLGGEEELRRLVEEASRVGKVLPGLLEAIIGLDTELYCPVVGAREDFQRFGALIED